MLAHVPRHDVPRRLRLSSSAGITAAEFLVVSGLMVSTVLIAFGFFREPLTDGITTLGHCINQAVKGNIADCGKGGGAQAAAAPAPAPPPPPPVIQTTAPSAALASIQGPNVLAAMMPAPTGGCEAARGMAKAAPGSTMPGCGAGAGDTVGTTGPGVPGFKNCAEARTRVAALQDDLSGWDGQLQQLAAMTAAARQEQDWWAGLRQQSPEVRRASTATALAEIARELANARADEARNLPGSQNRVMDLEQMAKTYQRDPWVGINQMIQHLRQQQALLGRWTTRLQAERDKTQAQLGQLQANIQNSGCAAATP